MDVPEKGALHLLHFEHETVYFCSKTCKQTYAQRSGMEKPASKKGMLGRFLEKLAKDNKDSFGGTPPKCH